jgi:hypothetical protein
MPDRYCFYRMTNDAGSAPNPFYGICTLAICTPNHQRALLSEGNVIVGVEADPLIRRRRKKRSDSTSARCIVYYMVIDKILDLDSYFRDPRFTRKIPNPGGSVIAARGDNCHYKDDKDVWCSILGHPHEHDQGATFQDQIGDRVFIGRQFYYFGDKAVPLPKEIEWQFVPGAQGIKYCDHPLPDFDQPVEAAARAFGKVGRIGNPIDMAQSGCDSSSRSESPRRGKGEHRACKDLGLLKAACTVSQPVILHGDIERHPHTMTLLLVPLFAELLYTTSEWPSGRWLKTPAAGRRQGFSISPAARPNPVPKRGRRLRMASLPFVKEFFQVDGPAPRPAFLSSEFGLFGGLAKLSFEHALRHR